MEKMTSKEFVHTLLDIWKSSDRRICFVLGAGASKSSGIRTGGELAKQWLGDIEQRMKDQSEKFEKFKADFKIEADYPGAAYPEIYKERFRFDADSGFDFINKEMEKARPGYGYSVLAQILAEKQHNIVITTNFDNLTEEALYIFTLKRPLICGHESLAVFAKPSVTRPLIVKIHRDRYFGPQSQPDEISRMNVLWVSALTDIFRSSTPVFIGYGGNDGSLMGYMEQVSVINNLFWCERKGSDISERVQKLLDKHNGKLVEIEGFDELMFSLQDQLSLKLLDKEIVEIATGRSKEYQETVEKIKNKQAKSVDKEVRRAVKNIAEKAENSWWSWELKTQATNKPDEKEKLYLAGLEKFPNSAELNGNYAVFLNDIRKNYDKAEKYFQKALSLDPGNATNNGNYANFLTKIRKNYDEAEKYFQKTLSLDADDATYNGNYAIFLHDIRKNYDQAEKYYQKALNLDPDNAGFNGNYAVLLYEIRKIYDKAEKYYQKALHLDPDNIKYNGNYAIFLNDIRKDHGNAEKYYQKALRLDPDNANYNSTYAGFLSAVRKNYDEAEKYYQRALSVDSDDANFNGNYAGFLFSVGKNEKANQYLAKAFNACNQNELLSELWFYKYAHVPAESAIALAELKKLLCEENVRSLGFSLQNNVDYAIQHNHPDPQLLQTIANIITNDAPADVFCHG